MSVKVKGSGVIEWKKPTYDFSREKFAATIEGTGPYAICLASASRPGGTHSKVGGFVIERVRVLPGQSRDGRIIVDLVAPTGGTGYGAENVDIPELDFGTSSRPLEQHPKMIRLKPSRKFYEYPDRVADEKENPGFATAEEAGNKGKTAAQRTFDHWQSLDELDVNGGTWSLAQYKQLKEAGKDSFDLSFPIARITTFHRDRPAGVGSGIHSISAPPGSVGAPSGWAYVKVSDGCRYEGDRWRRVQEWEGQLGSESELNALLY